MGQDYSHPECNITCNRYHWYHIRVQWNWVWGRFAWIKLTTCREPSATTPNGLHQLLLYCNPFLALRWFWAEGGGSKGGGWGKWSDFLNTWGPLTCPSTGCSTAQYTTVNSALEALHCISVQHREFTGSVLLAAISSQTMIAKTHQESRFFIFPCPSYYF